MRLLVCLNVLVWCVLCLGAQPPELRQMAERIVPVVAIPDTEAEFFAAWNLNAPGLETVKAAVQAGDYDHARVALKNYFLARRTPPWKRNHWDMPAQPAGKPEDHSRFAEGEKVLTHQFAAGGYEVDFGEKIDWNYFPKTLPDGRIDYEYPVTHTINRFGHLAYVLGPLYWFSHDERYAREFADEVTDFVLSYPAPEKYTSDAPGPWRQLTAAAPLNGTWLDAYNYFLPSESFTPQAHAVMLKGFVEKARFAVRNPNAVNRYMIQLAGIYNVGAYFPELREAAALREFAVHAMECAVDDEFYPDSISKELCPGYHGGSRGAINRIIESAALMGYETPQKLFDGVKATYDVYPLLATPQWGLPRFGDTWSAGDIQKVFAAVEGRYDDPVYTWFATSRKQGTPPEFISTRMPWAGFYVMRSGWEPEALYLCMDAGPMGRDHWHEDFNNFECYAYGESLISEVGIYSYTQSKWNQYFRSSHAHNTVICDGYSQKRGGTGPFEVDTPRENDWHSDEVFDLAWGVYDGKWSAFDDYRGKNPTDLVATHRRDICFVKNSYWIICDRLASAGEHLWSQLFHFMPDRTVVAPDDASAGTDDPGRANIRIIQVDPVRAQPISGREEEPPQGWYSAEQGEIEPAAMLSYDQTATDTARYDTILLPLPPGVEADISVERLPVRDAEGNSVTADDVCALRIVTPAGTDYFINDLRQSEIGPANGMLKRAGPVVTDCRAAVVRLDPQGTVIAASAAGATTLTLEGKALR